MGVLAWLIGGLIVGVLAQWLVKGPHGLGCIGTVGLGIIGSLVGGTVLNAINGEGFEFAASGFLGSLLGAVLLLVLARLFQRSGTG